MGRAACALQSPEKWPHPLGDMIAAFSRDMCSVQIKHFAPSYHELLHYRLLNCGKRS